MRRLPDSCREFADARAAPVSESVVAVVIVPKCFDLCDSTPRITARVHAQPRFSAPLFFSLPD
jgi:hypothetical protein